MNSAPQPTVIQNAVQRSSSVRTLRWTSAAPNAKSEKTRTRLANTSVERGEAVVLGRQEPCDDDRDDHARDLHRDLREADPAGPADHALAHRGRARPLVRLSVRRRAGTVRRRCCSPASGTSVTTAGTYRTGQSDRRGTPGRGYGCADVQPRLRRGRGRGPGRRRRGAGSHARPGGRRRLQQRRHARRAASRRSPRWTHVDVTVVDNASPDASLDAIAHLDVDAVRAPDNRGFAAGCNIGIARSDAPYVLLLNPDARMTAADLDILRGVLDARPRRRAGRATAPRVRRQHRLEPVPLPAPALDVRAGAVPPPALAAGRLDRRARSATPRRTRWPARPSGCPAPACSSAVPRSTRSARWTSRFFMYCEDIDLCARLAAAGWELRYEPAASVHHEGGVSHPRSGLLAVHARARVRLARKREGALAGARRGRGRRARSCDARPGERPPAGRAPRPPQGPAGRDPRGGTPRMSTLAAGLRRRHAGPQRGAQPGAPRPRARGADATAEARGSSSTTARPTARGRCWHVSPPSCRGCG